MAQTTVNTPIGKVTVNHPDGATDEQILAFAQQDVSRRQARRAELEAEFSQDQATGVSDSNFQNFLAGSGKAFVDLGRGVRQLAVEGADLIPGVDLTDTANELRQDQRLVRERDDALLDTKSGLAGNIGTNIGVALTPGGLVRGGANLASRSLQAFSNPNTFRAAAASGGIQGALQPVADDELRSFNTALGGALGGVGRAITRPFANSATAGQQRAINTLDDAGVRIDVGQRTQSSAAQRLTTLLDDSAITSGQRDAFRDGALRDFTRATLRTIGADADEATPGVMLRAKNDISNVFRDFAENRPMRADGRFVENMQQIAADARESLTDAEFNLFARNFRNVAESIQGESINGSRFTSHLRRLNNITGRPDVGPHARAMETALLDALERSQPQAAVDALRGARGQWRNLRVIQTAIDKGEDRLISPLRLSNALATKRNQSLSVFGQGQEISSELVDLARAGRTILVQPPNSGTPLRQQIPTGAAIAGLGAVGGTPAVAAGVGAARALPPILQAQGRTGRLLANGLPPGAASPIIQSLISRGLLHQEQQLE